MKNFDMEISKINSQALRIPWIAVSFFIFLIACVSSSAAQVLEVGMAKTAISPPLGTDRPPVWIAGYNNGRQATAIHDDIWARCMLVRVIDGNKTKSIALVSLDLIGYFYPETLLTAFSRSRADLLFLAGSTVPPRPTCIKYCACPNSWPASVPVSAETVVMPRKSRTPPIVNRPNLEPSTPEQHSDGEWVPVFNN